MSDTKCNRWTNQRTLFCGDAQRVAWRRVTMDSYGSWLSPHPLTVGPFLAVVFIIAVCAGLARGDADGTAGSSRFPAERALPHLSLQLGHDGPVEHVAFLPDGRTILTISQGEGRLWSLAERWEIGRVGRTLQRPSSVVRLPDGRVAVAVVAEDSAVLWDLGGDREIGRFEHGRQVSCVALSADGRMLVASGEGGLIRVWEIATRAERKHFEARASQSFALAPDNRTILCFGEGGQIWDLESGRMVRPLQRIENGHDISSAAFSPDSRLILTGDASYTGRGHLFDVATGRELRKFEFGANVTSVAFAPDGRSAFTGGAARCVLLWDISTEKSSESREPSQRFDHESEIRKIAISPDGRAMVTSTFTTGDARVWDVKNGRTLGRLEGTVDTVGSLTISPDGRAILIDSSDPTRRLVERSTGRVIEQLPEKASHRTAMEYEFTLGERPGRTLRVWDAATGRQILRSRHAGAITGVDVARGGRKVVLVDDGRTARVLEADTHRVVTLDHGEGCRNVAFSPDGLHIVTHGRTAKLWETASGRLVREFVEEGVEIDRATFSPDGKWLLTGGRAPRLWDMSRNQVDVRVDHGEDCVTANWSPDGRRVLTLGRTGKLWEWSAGSARLSAEFDLVEPTVNGPLRVDPKIAAIAPDGDKLLFAGNGGSVWVHDVETRQGHRILDAGFKLRLLAFSRDGRQAMAVGDRLTIWDAKTWQEVIRTAGGEHAVFTPDGRMVLIAGTDKSARLLDAATGQLICRLVSSFSGAWSVVSADGRFDSDDLESISSVHWLFPDDPFRPLPPEIFAREFFEPRLLPRLLAGEVLPTLARRFEQLNRVQPEILDPTVRIEGDTAHVTLRVRARGNRDRFGEGESRREMVTDAYDLRLFRDGQLVWQHPELGSDPKGDLAVRTEEQLEAWRRASAIIPKGDGEWAEFVVPVRLPHRRAGQELKITAYCFNCDRVKSRTAAAGQPARIPAGLEAGRPKAYVVGLGVNASQTPDLDLRFAARDATRLVAALGSRLEAVGYEVRAVTLLSDYEGERFTGRRAVTQATRGNLQAVLDRLAGRPGDPHAQDRLPAEARSLDRCRPDDLVVLFIASHGFTDRSTGLFHLLPYDVGRHDLAGDRESTLRAILEHSSITSADLARWLRGVDAGELALILDTCMSQGAVQAGEFKPGPFGSRGLGQLAYDKGMRVLAAAQTDEFAIETDRGGLGHGLLTYSLLEGLGVGCAGRRPAAVGTDGRVTFGGWLTYAAERVPNLYTELRELRFEDCEGRPRTQEARSDWSPGALRALGEQRWPALDRELRLQRPALFDYSRNRPETVLYGGEAGQGIPATDGAGGARPRR